ncbi:MAG: cysteine--tRNA ligase [bacterium]
MGLKIYNSLTNTIENFVPNDKNKVKLYVCGPTVYNSIHIGNARPVVFFDMFKRYLNYKGFEVEYATNITDVDDKIINKALELNEDEKTFANKHASNFLKNVEELNCLPFDHVPYATDYIPNMVSFIEELIKKDLAYVVDGDVYFRVEKNKNYGVLSNQKIEELNNGVRIENSSKKERPLDFTLWKETEKGLKWETSFSNGRPGWHTECVCMIDSIFKGSIDVHGGGFDLKFPHHENEIAQYDAIHNKELSKYFMHVGRLDINGEKMSKSVGNMILVDDLRNDNSFMAYKLLVLMHNYRGQINFSDELFDSYKKDYEKILRSYKQAKILLDVNNINGGSIINEYIEEFEIQMNNDFNTPNVYTLIQKIFKDLNVQTRSKEFSNINSLVLTVENIFDVLGISLPYTKMNESDIATYKAWEDARIKKDFTNADVHRNALVERGIL